MTLKTNTTTIKISNNEIRNKNKNVTINKRLAPKLDKN